MTPTLRMSWRDHHIDRRSGFTLVELLVVIAVIAILSSMLLMGLWGVAENARASRTRSVIQRIDTYVRARWDAYMDRRIGVQMLGPLRLPRFPSEVEYMRILDPTGSNAAAIRADRFRAYGRFVAYVRLAAIREIQRMELPDRKADLMTPRELGVGVPPIIVPDPTDPRSNLVPPVLRNQMTVVLDSVPALWRTYRAKAESLVKAKFGPTADWRTRWTATNETAECLYLILSTMADDERAALEWFKESEIGDTDGDGMPEVLDAWGTPITFIRWPSGFVKEYTAPPQHFQVSYLPYSDIMSGDQAWQEDGTTTVMDDNTTLQNFQNQGDPGPSLLASLDWQNTGGSDDPFDPLKVDVRWYDAPNSSFGVSQPFTSNRTYHAWNNDPYEVTPLIVSAGPDKQYDLAFSIFFPPWFATQLPAIGAQSDGVLVPNDPYVTRRYGGRYIHPGSIIRSSATANLRSHAAGDNIHNHLLEAGGP